MQNTKVQNVVIPKTIPLRRMNSEGSKIPSSSDLFSLPLAASSTSHGNLPCAQDELDDGLGSLAVPDRRKQGRAVVAHQVGVALHHLERGTDVGCEVGLRGRRARASESHEGSFGQMTSRRASEKRCEISHLVDDEQIRLTDARTSLARDLVPSRDVDLNRNEIHRSEVQI